MIGNLARSALLVGGTVKSPVASQVCQSRLLLASAVPGMAEVETRSARAGNMWKRPLKRSTQFRLLTSFWHRGAGQTAARCTTRCATVPQRLAVHGGWLRRLLCQLE